MRTLVQKIFLASAVAAMAALTTSSALADVKVNVPFSFKANGKLCPAGYYSVGRDDTTGTVTLRNATWLRTFSWLAGPGDPAPTDNRIILRFDKVGDGYTLESVQYRSLITAQLDKKHNRETPGRMVIGQ